MSVIYPYRGNKRVSPKALRAAERLKREVAQLDATAERTRSTTRCGGAVIIRRSKANVKAED